MFLAEKPHYDDSEQCELYRANKPRVPPKKNTNECKQLRKFCQTVEIILQTVDEKEYQAAVTFMEAPADNFSRAVVYPSNGMVVGKFAGMKTALIQTDSGEKCRVFVEDAIKTFPNAQFVIAVGVSYAFDSTKYKLGDVLVSNKISNLTDMTFNEDGEMQDSDQTVDIVYEIRKIFCKDLIHDPEYKVSDTRYSKVHCGRMASYSDLMTKQEYRYREKFHAAFPTAIGGEIVGARSGDLLKFVQEKKCKLKGVIVIKGVADYADDSKTEMWKLTAAMAAVHYTQSKLLYVPSPIDSPEDTSSLGTVPSASVYHENTQTPTVKEFDRSDSSSQAHDQGILTKLLLVNNNTSPYSSP